MIVRYRTLNDLSKKDDVRRFLELLICKVDISMKLSIEWGRSRFQVRVCFSFGCSSDLPIEGASSTGGPCLCSSVLPTTKCNNYDVLESRKYVRRKLCGQRFIVRSILVSLKRPCGLSVENALV